MSLGKNKVRAIIGVGVIMTVALVLLWVPLFPLKTVYYIQRKHHDQELCYIWSPRNPIEVAAMSRTLHEYGERHFVVRDRIFISFMLFIDKDLLRNFTSKAGLACPDNRFVLDSNYPECDLWIEASLKKEDGGANKILE